MFQPPEQETVRALVSLFNTVAVGISALEFQTNTPVFYLLLSHLFLSMKSNRSYTSFTYLILSVYLSIYLAS